MRTLFRSVCSSKLIYDFVHIYTWSFLVKTFTEVTHTDGEKYKDNAEFRYRESYYNFSLHWISSIESVVHFQSKNNSRYCYWLENLHEHDDINNDPVGQTVYALRKFDVVPDTVQWFKHRMGSELIFWCTTKEQVKTHHSWKTVVAFCVENMIFLHQIYDIDHLIKTISGTMFFMDLDDNTTIKHQHHIASLKLKVTDVFRSVNNVNLWYF